MLRVLVVEDHADLRETLALLLEAPSREVTACASAEEALALFENVRFDVVFSDLNLPRLSGLELAQRLEAIAPSTWIVLSSGGVAPAAADEHPRLRFLAKPFAIEALEALVAEVEGAAPPG